MINALSIDVEDWYHTTILQVTESSRPESRVHDNTLRVLDILDSQRTQATFFVLGCVAKADPGLVKAIASRGHEIATHGFFHTEVGKQTREQFVCDLKRSIGVLEDMAGRSIIGYRAPSFSINRRTLWALGVLDSEGIRYDSSIFPMKTTLYGATKFPQRPFRPERLDLIEFPPSTARILGVRVPVCGGGYLRLFPYFITKAGITKINRMGIPAMIYFHPWEIDFSQPRTGASSWRRFIHYHNLDKMEGRIRRLLHDFEFAPIRQVLQLVDQ